MPARQCISDKLIAETVIASARCHAGGERDAENLTWERPIHRSRATPRSEEREREREREREGGRGRYNATEREGRLGTCRVINITIHRAAVYKGRRLTFIKIPKPAGKYVKSGRWPEREGEEGEKCGGNAPAPTSREKRY